MIFITPENEWAVKRNIIDSMIAKDFTPQMLYIFGFYLAHIDPRKESNKVKLEYGKLCGLIDDDSQGASPVEALSSLMTKAILVPGEEGAVVVTFFSRVKLVDDVNGVGLCIELTGHKEGIDLLLAYRRDFFRYRLWNVLNLKNTRQIRLYELLKQSEDLQFRVFDIDVLKRLIGIEGLYMVYQNFKMRVLDPCQQAMSDKTDICFDYAPERIGKNGKVESVRLTVRDNPKMSDEINMVAFLGAEKLAELESLEPVQGPETDADNSSFLNLTDVLNLLDTETEMF